MLFLCRIALAVVSVHTAMAQIEAAPSTSGITKIDITQHTDGNAGSVATIIGAAEKLAWPITVLLLLLFYRKTIETMVSEFSEKGGELSIAGLAIKFPVMKAIALDDDVLSFKTSDPVIITNDSMKTTLLRMLRDPSQREYIVINLGEGQEWVTSRLFIFTIMLRTMKAVRCIVFLEGSVPKFLGIARPDRIRWALAQGQPCLEKAYLTALTQSIQSQPEPFVNNEGALDSQIAENAIRAFIREVGPNSTACAGAQPPKGKQWAKLGNNIEYGTWLSGVDVQQLIGAELYKDAVSEAAEHATEAKALLQLTAPWVARVKTTGEFLSLIDRTAFINGVMTRLLARAESASGVKR